MSLAGRQFVSHKCSLRGLAQSISPRQIRPLTHRRHSGARNAIARTCTDARLAQPDNSGTAPSQQHEREAILLQRFKAHDAAVTATLVLQDAGALSGDTLSGPYLQQVHPATLSLALLQATPRKW